MKTLITVMAVMMVTLSFGVAYAIDDQMPAAIGISNTGPVVHDATDWSTKDAGAVLSFTDGDVFLPLGPSNSIGAVLAREEESRLTEKSAKGSAAGGMSASTAGRVAPESGSNWYGIAY